VDAAVRERIMRGGRGREPLVVGYGSAVQACGLSARV